MITLNNVSKRFGKEEAVKPLTVTFEAGKIHGIVGRNGSGKTVLMKLISGLLLPTTGIITVDGQQIGKDVDFPPDMGIIIETPGFLSYETGFQNLKNLAVLNKKINNARIRDTIRMVGMDPDSKKKVGKYSLGMRQRLGIAQAIMENPRLLILDEPMNALDKDGVKEVRALLRILRDEGRTILLSSHNVEDIRILCDEIYEMDRGSFCRIADKDGYCE